MDNSNNYNISLRSMNSLTVTVLRQLYLIFFKSTDKTSKVVYGDIFLFNLLFDFYDLKLRFLIF